MSAYILEIGSSKPTVAWLVLFVVAELNDMTRNHCLGAAGELRTTIMGILSFFALFSLCIPRASQAKGSINKAAGKGAQATVACMQALRTAR